MDTVTRVLATTSEISLKGGNRRWFEQKLANNVNKALAGLPVARVSRPAWRVLIAFSEPVAFTEVARRLGTVFGLGAIMAVEHAGSTLETLQSLLEKRLPDLRAESLRCGVCDPTSASP